MTHSGRAYLLVPVIYTGVIFGLLFLQFSGGERFSRSVGPLTLHATRGATSDEGIPEVRELELAFDGLSFMFDEENGLIVETASDLSDKRVTGYEVRDDGFRLRFEDGFRLSFVISADPTRELQIRLDIPSDPAGLRQVSIPYSFSGEPMTAPTQPVSFVTLTVEDQEYYFTTPPQASIDLGNRRIVLRPEAAGQAVRYVRATEGDPARIAGWFDDETLAISDEDFRATIDRFVDAAYEGWSVGRYDAIRVAWRGPGGVTRFSEEALTAYLSEAWVRDDYDRAFAEMRRARDLHPDSLTLLSSTFLGNLREVRSVFLESDRLEAEAIGEQIAAEDFTVFRRAGLFGFAADRGSEELYTALLDLTTGMDPRRLDVVSAVGLLRNLHLHPLPDQRAEELRERMSDLIESALLGSIVSTDDGFYLQTSPGQIDLEQTVIAGLILEAYGQSLTDRPITNAGRNLVTAVLDRADANGVIPSTLLVRGDTVETADGQLVPESIYPLLARGGAYPRQRSLYRAAGSGHWIWSSVDVTPIRVDETEWRFGLTYPRLRTHYIIVQGVPVFQRMELFGQTWRDAPDFEVYSKGRHFNSETNTLMIKYYDDSVSREFVLFL